MKENQRLKVKIYDILDKEDKIIECKVAALYSDGTIRIEYPCYDYRGYYIGYECTTITKNQIVEVL